MRYHCRECSYRGNKLSPAGSCPACGSFDIHVGIGELQQAEPKSRKLQLAVLIALWAVFAGLLLSRLLS
ncbi:hypothetical protein [Haliea sp.]